MRRLRNFIAISLLLVFSWCRVAEALPLVWCLGSDGHSVIELADSTGCNSPSKVNLYLDSGYQVSLLGVATGGHDECQDIALSHEVTVAVSAPKTDSKPAKLPAVIAVWPKGSPKTPVLGVSFPPRDTANQLAQLRTVILRL